LAAHLDLGLNRRDQVRKANLASAFREGTVGGLVQEACHNRGRVEDLTGVSTQHGLAPQRPPEMDGTDADFAIRGCEARGPA
jgi:hypothetical protein